MQKNSFTFIVIICPITNLLPQFFCVLKYIFVKYTNSPFFSLSRNFPGAGKTGIEPGFLWMGGQVRLFLPQIWIFQRWNFQVFQTKFRFEFRQGWNFPRPLSYHIGTFLLCWLAADLFEFSYHRCLCFNYHFCKEVVKATDTFTVSSFNRPG